MLTLSLTTVVLLTFYLNQFSAIVTALTQFVFLFFMAAYRQWHLTQTATPVAEYKQSSIH